MIEFNKYVANERNNFMLEQKRIHTDNRKFVTDYMNKELSRTHNIFTRTTHTSIEEITTASTSQQDLINDLSTNM